MTLRLRSASTAYLHSELCRAYPEEGCGVLLGHDDGADRIVERVIALPNAGDMTRDRRYVIAPDAFVRVEREARAAGLEVVGFYHSHPDHPAQPSAFDVEHAWPYYSYVIASIERGRPGATTAWRLAADRSRFEPETIDLAAPLPDEAADPPVEHST